MTDPALPIYAVLPKLTAALRDRSCAVLVAPPGAGKTTAVAPVLLGEPWCGGEILLLSPRRLAARAAAERMAELAGEPVGRTFGYATRMDTRTSAATRVTVLTEGIFVARVQADPELAGVSAVLFDEVHERSLDGDFGLALALDAQAGLRPDLRLVAMSATLDGARFAALMGDAPVIESAGRSYPLELRYIGRDSNQRIEDAVAGACRQASRETEGGVLAFLPGVAEIERTAERLGDLPGVVLHKLHGNLDPREQRAAIALSDARKLVLATSIAETSLTLAGISVVVDSGLARRPRYDRAAGTTRLATERASRAAVTQRAGRAARLGPGVAFRLWEEAATAGLPPYDPPQILEADLSGLVLACALWGVADPRDLRWLDPPPAAAVAEARARLQRLDALDADGRPSAHGRAIAALPLEPRLAHMLIRAGELGLARQAAEVAALLGERGVGGNDADLETRLRRWRGERGQRADAARKLAERWAKLVENASPSPSRPPSAGSSLSQWEREGAGSPQASGKGEGGGGGVGSCIALAFPDRIARRRDPSGETWASVGGRGFRLDPASSLAREEWLAVAETAGMAAGARIVSAAPIALADIEALFGDRFVTRDHIAFDRETGGIGATSERLLGAIRLSRTPLAELEAEAVAAALLNGVRQHGLSILPWPEEALALRARAAFAGDAPDDAALLARADEWLAPLLAGKRRLDQVTGLTDALKAALGWDALQAIERLAPARLATPAGSSHTIDYAAEAGPTVTLRPQELFGMAAHPMVAGGRVPLVLSLTSPAGRPIQTTRDLPGFWSGSWAAMAKEMRGRYPRHPWPDDPAAASATTRTKNADARRNASR